jgi:hypothetical protein
MNAPERFGHGDIRDGKVALKIINGDIGTFLNEVNKQTSLSNVNNFNVFYNQSLVSFTHSMLKVEKRFQRK